MVGIRWLRQWMGSGKRGEVEAAHLVRGIRGEAIACRYLQEQGMKFLAANYRSRRGEIDLVFRDDSCLVFVEVKTRSSESWVRPAAAVHRKKQRLLSLAALEYLRAIGNPMVPMRFDIVEVLMAGGEVREVRHLVNAFPMAKPYRYG
jgi:putative endonuclease